MGLIKGFFFFVFFLKFLDRDKTLFGRCTNMTWVHFFWIHVTWTAVVLCRSNWSSGQYVKLNYSLLTDIGSPHFRRLKGHIISFYFCPKFCKVVVEANNIWTSLYFWRKKPSLTLWCKSFFNLKASAFAFSPPSVSFSAQRCGRLSPLLLIMSTPRVLSSSQPWTIAVPSVPPHISLSRTQTRSETCLLPVNVLKGRDSFPADTSVNWPMKTELL